MIYKAEKQITWMKKEEKSLRKSITFFCSFPFLEDKNRYKTLSTVAMYK